MESKKEEIPKTIDQLMEIYSKYEKQGKAKETTIDFMQYNTFKSNPITPFHAVYYKTKFKTKHYSISYLLLTISIVFYVLYFVGFILEVYVFRIGLEEEWLLRILLFAIPTGYVVLLISIFAKNFNKWNWVSYATFSAILIAILFSFIATFRLFTGERESIYEIFYTVSGLSLGPACLTFYLTFRFHHYITDYGGIHLYLGWIYRISQTHGDLKSLHRAFERLLLDLDSWLNNTLKLVIKNRIEILENFSLNIISNENFMADISKNNKIEFENALNGLLVEDILNSDTFKDVKPENKKIGSLGKFDVKYLSYRVALDQLPKITTLIEKLSSKKLEVLYYSTSKKFSKYKTQILPILIFVFGTLLPVLLPLFI
ncbi:MAG: hypothetical protein ACFE9N_15935 [Promethearchaeota archaeon]